MITHEGNTLPRFLRDHGWPLLPIVGLCVATEAAYLKFDLNTTSVITLATVGILITALSIFLGFRVNEAYERWWEARKLWGGLVNVSRSFARKVNALVVPKSKDPSDVAAATRLRVELIHRHIAYVHALRIALRNGPAIGDRTALWGEVEALIPAAEWEALTSVANVPTQLLQAQGRALTRWFEGSTQAQLAHLELERTLDVIDNIQGACERIKTTVFPARVTTATRTFVWSLTVILPLAMLDADRKSDVIEILAVSAMGYLFVTIERLGHELKRPFENKPNDTPMTALCRVIEVDLRQVLGETEMPAVIEMQDGVVM